MKRAMLFFSMFLFLLTPVFSMAEEAATDAPVVEAGETEAEAITSEVIVLEDGTEEVQISIPSEEVVHVYVDDRILAIESEAQEKILAVVEEIDQLADRSEEGELQKEIERIKLDAEIARLKIYVEDAEDAQDFDLAYEIRDEIDHLENLDQPVVGFPEEQPAPRVEMAQ